ncbi:hypothetical protein [Okeania sp. SIO2C2]|nr:hypothetical protein [Okeania sp. SIO2C2]
MLKKSFSRGRRQEKRGIIEEVVGKIEGQFFCHNHPKILAS